MVVVSSVSVECRTTSFFVLVLKLKVYVPPEAVRVQSSLTEESIVHPLDDVAVVVSSILPVLPYQRSVVGL